MITYDLDLDAWVRSPGSSAPPPMTPVLTVGSMHVVPVLFVRGASVEPVTGATFFCGIKITGDFTGPYVGSDSTPTKGGDGTIYFAIDLDTTAANAYFAVNTNEETASAELQVVMTLNGVKTKTTPLAVVLQQDYTPDK